MNKQQRKLEIEIKDCSKLKNVVKNVYQIKRPNFTFDCSYGYFDSVVHTDQESIK